MPFVGRVSELGRLRSLLDLPEPQVVRVFGLPGVGCSSLVARAVQGAPTWWLDCPPLPAPDQRAALSARIGLDQAELPSTPRRRGTRGTADGPPSWDALLGVLAQRAEQGRRPGVLVLDDAHRLEEARAQLHAPSRSTSGPPLHLVLVGPDPERLPSPGQEENRHDVSVRPLRLRHAAGWLPGRTPREKLVAYSVFGGVPAHLARVDPNRALGESIEALFLQTDGPFRNLGVRLLEARFQTPSRYSALLRGLAFGEAAWSDLLRSVSDVDVGGQLAPYIRRLESSGLVEVRRSLDASPSGRSRRYGLIDPAYAFWFRWVLGRQDGHPGRDSPPDMAPILADVDRRASGVFARVCRQFMEHDATEVLTGGARAVGSLWGAGYDLPVAGVLATGSPFYGSCHWDEPPGASALVALDRQVRETRYGFGRERRLRMLFSPDPWSVELSRTAARRDDTFGVSLAAMLGGP